MPEAWACPRCSCPLLTPFVLALLAIALAVVVIVVGPPLLLELLNGGFQSHNLLQFGGRGIPCLGLVKALVLVVRLRHEGVRIEVMSFLILVLLGTDVIAEILVRDLLVCLEEEG